MCFTKTQKNAVMVDGGLSDPSDVTTGVLQGDFLAPVLFVVLVDYLLKKATSQLDSGGVTHPRRSRQHPAKSLNDLHFADDIALLESSISRAQAQLTKTAEAAADLGFVISAPKTEYMIVYCNPQPALQVYGDPINHVSDFRYLGSMVASGPSDLKGESHLLGVPSGSWNNFGRVHTYPLQQKLSYLILLVSLYYSMAVNRG